MQISDVVLGRIEKCQICGSGIERIISFGHQAPVQAYLTGEQLHQPETEYPLNWCRCPACGLVQLDYAPDPRVVFPKEYPYQSGMTKILVENFADLARKVAERFGLQQGDFVVDIGSNDGTLLQNFRSRGCRVLGIEPTDVAGIAIKNGIPTINKFFNERVADEIAISHGKAKVVTAANVFAHVNALFSMVRGIRKLLDDNGLFVSESHYLLDLVDKCEFDTIYHEHLRFYSLKPLIQLHETFGFKVIDAERIPTHGGSVRVYAVKKENPLSGQASQRLQELLRLEEAAGLYRKETYDGMAKRILHSKHRLLSLLLDIKKADCSIAGISAPARASTLLDYGNIDSSILDYIAERRGSLKIGLFTPGTHIPIVDEERLFSEQPDYALVLSWHIGDELMKKLRQNGYRGKFIMPLPEPGIVDGI